MRLGQQKYFPTQEKEEKIILLLRKHWFNYVIFFLLDALVAIPLVIFVAYWAQNPEFIRSTVGDVAFMSLSILVLFMLAAQLYGFVDYYLDVYIVTNQRIVDISQGGFFKRQIAELHLHQVQDVNANVEGFWGTLLHFGNVHIQTAGERANFVFSSIPHPYRVAKSIIDLHESHIERSSKSNKQRKAPGSKVGEDADEGLPYGRAGLENPPMASKTRTSLKAEDQLKPSDINQGKARAITPLNSGQNLSVDSNPGSDEEKYSPMLEGQLEEGREIDLEP